MKKLYAITLVFLAGTAHAQSPWTLQECIHYALAHNIQLQQTDINNQINRNNTLQSKAAVLPSVNLGAAHQYNFGQTIDRFTNTFANTQVLSQNFWVSSNVILWSGLSQHNTIKANEYNYLSGVEFLKQQQNDLSLGVANAYIGVIFADELLKISQNQRDISKEQLERTQKLVNAGSAAKSLEFDIKAQLANEEVNVTVAENNYNIAILTLRQFMNLDSISNFSVVRPEVETSENALLDTELQKIYETSLKNQPIIKSTEYTILSSERFLAAARGRRSPTLSFGASLGTGTSGLARDIVGYNTRLSTLRLNGPGGITEVSYETQEPVLRKTSFADQVRNNFNQSLGFTLNIPLFNGLQVHTSIKNAQLSAFNAKLSQDLAKQNLYKSIAQAQADAKAALNKYDASQLSVEAAAESFKYAQQKLNAGVISAFDFNTSKNRLFVAESQLLQAKYDYIFKLKVLDFYLGRPLGF